MAVANSRLLESDDRLRRYKARQRNCRVPTGNELTGCLAFSREGGCHCPVGLAPPPRPLRPGGAPPLAYAARQKGVPPRAYLWQGPGFYTSDRRICKSVSHDPFNNFLRQPSDGAPRTASIYCLQYISIHPVSCDGVVC